MHTLRRRKDKSVCVRELFVISHVFRPNFKRIECHKRVCKASHICELYSLNDKKGPKRTLMRTVRNFVQDQRSKRNFLHFSSSRSRNSVASRKFPDSSPEGGESSRSSISVSSLRISYSLNIESSDS